MKQKYIQITSDGIISNTRLEELSKDYKVIGVYNDHNNIVYMLKRMNWFARTINKLF
jgi:hypothetical protein